jgi:1-acyl-sn-glycerol-3-phosphate acyltransferase
MLPLSLLCLSVVLLLCLLLLPTYKQTTPERRDRRAAWISYWMLATVRFRIRVTDHNASSAAHSRLYVASHVSMMESIMLFNVAGHIRTIAAEFTRNHPVIGVLAKISNPIFVPRQRQGGPSVVDLMRESLDTTDERLSIFPEGTFSNATALLKFKTGAFVLGKPVTPVVFKYPVYVPFWNRNESSFATQLFRLLARVSTPVEVIVLPTWHPTALEQEDPRQYSENVRRLMAQHLDLPLSDQGKRDSPNFKRDQRDTTRAAS